MTHYVTHLEGAIDGAAIPFGSLVGTHAGRPVLARVRDAVSPAAPAKP
jgi:hypothetical protein